MSTDDKNFENSSMNDLLNLGDLYMSAPSTEIDLSVLYTIESKLK